MTDGTRIDAIVTTQGIHTDWTRIDRIVDNLPADRPVTTGYDGGDLTVGQRVELHPGCTLWARGARFGTIVKIGTRRQKAGSPLVAVQLDKQPDGARLMFHADRMRAI